MSYKRQRSRAGDSAKQHSGEGRIKRRQRDRRRNGRSVSRTYSLSEHRSGQFRSMYEAVLALLADLRLEDSASNVIDDHASALVRNICEYFARLNITQIDFTQNDHSSNVTITAVSKSREFVLASLTSSEQMSSTADLAAHLLRMLQFQSPQLRSTLMAPVDDTSLQTDFIAHDNHSLSWVIDGVDSETAMPSARQYGVTYPSALLDDTNVSGCSIPIYSGS